MLQRLAWQAADRLARAQLAMVHALSDEISLSPDDRRRALNLDEAEWKAWMDFLTDGPLPVQPPLPEMLRRLGEISFNLSTVALQRGTIGWRQPEHSLHWVDLVSLPMNWRYVWATGSAPRLWLIVAGLCRLTWQRRTA